MLFSSLKQMMDSAPHLQLVVLWIVAVIHVTFLPSSESLKSLLGFGSQLDNLAWLLLD